MGTCEGRRQLARRHGFHARVHDLAGLDTGAGPVPIPELRSLILATQTTLIGTIGDSLAFVESPLRAALIRGRILEGSRDLKAAASAP